MYAASTFLRPYIFLANRTRRRAHLFCSGPYVWSGVSTLDLNYEHKLKPSLAMQFDWLEAAEREKIYVFRDMSRSDVSRRVTPPQAAL